MPNLCKLPPKLGSMCLGYRTFPEVDGDTQCLACITHILLFWSNVVNCATCIINITACFIGQPCVQLGISLLSNALAAV